MYAQDYIQPDLSTLLQFVRFPVFGLDEPLQGLRLHQVHFTLDQDTQSLTRLTLRYQVAQKWAIIHHAQIPASYPYADLSAAGQWVGVEIEGLVDDFETDALHWDAFPTSLDDFPHLEYAAQNGYHLSRHLNGPAIMLILTHGLTKNTFTAFHNLLIPLHLTPHALERHEYEWEHYHDKTELV